LISISALKVFLQVSRKLQQSVLVCSWSKPTYNRRRQPLLASLHLCC